MFHDAHAKNRAIAQPGQRTWQRIKIGSQINNDIHAITGLHVATNVQPTSRKQLTVILRYRTVVFTADLEHRRPSATQIAADPLQLIDVAHDRGHYDLP